MVPPHEPAPGAASLTPTDVVPARELRAVRDVVDKLEAAVKTYRLFPPYHVHVQSAAAALEGSLVRYFAASQQALGLDTRRRELFYRGAAVYQAGREHGFCEKVAEHGVARLTFHAGVQRRELVQLLDVLRTVERSPAEDDDFVTLLWEKECEHIQPELHQARQDPVVLPRLAAPEALAARCFPPAPPIDAASAGAGASELAAACALTDAERDRLRRQALRECAARPLHGLPDAALAVFELDHEPSSLERALRLVHGTTLRLTERLELGAANDLLEELQALGRRGDALGQAAADAVVSLRAALSTGTPLDAVLAPLGKEPHPPSDEVLRHLRWLDAPALDPLLAVFLRHPQCGGLAPTLARLGGPAALPRFAQGLGSSDEAIVAATLDLLLAIDPAQAAPHVLRLLSHADATRRRRAVEAVARLPAGTVAQIAQLALDPDAGVRRAAVKALRHAPVRTAFGPLWQLWEERARRELGAADEELVLEAAVAADPELAAELLAALLARKPLLGLGRVPLEEAQRLAVQALTRIAHPKTAVVLQRFAATPGDGFVPRLCRSALAARAKGTTAP